MKTARILIAVAALAMVSTVDADAQGFGGRLLKKVGQKAEEAVTRKAEQATEKAIDKATDPGTYKGDENNQQQQQQGANAPANAGNADGSSGNAAAPPKGQSLEMTYAKSDFVAGDEIIFDDPMDAEQLGEFPSQWDLLDGTAEVVSVNGKKAIDMFKWGTNIMPLMKNPKNYLGDVFTLEFDFLIPSQKEGDEYNSQWFTLTFYTPDGSEVMNMAKATYLSHDSRMSWRWFTTNGSSNGAEEVVMADNTWQHFAISFNKRAYKIYVNGVRIANVPNVVNPPGYFTLSVGNGSAHSNFTNFRIAKGAVPLYDRMMSDGKFITYGITFDVGKSTIKPESMGEINRIVTLLNENPTLKFSVEGHTDSTGNAASNQTLSDARSKAVVDKLVENGIAADRLTSAGKGQNNPIADNGTDEGRAKNRRVEFVKIN